MRRWNRGAQLPLRDRGPPLPPSTQEDAGRMSLAQDVLVQQAPTTRTQCATHVLKTRRIPASKHHENN